ncbi:zinc finger, CCHC-type containing protein [Tanacetum coccineum]
MHKLVKGVPVIKHQDQACESCMVGKQTKKSFSKKETYRASQILEMVHGDICGPINPLTQEGNSYILVLIDDCFRYMWSFLLKHKSDALGVVKRFKTSTEKRMGKEIITFYTDRGGEFTSHNFNRFCGQEGIARMLTAPYAPQQNGIMERRNRTLLEMTRCITKARGVPNYFWGEAVRHETYIINRTPTRALVGVMPYEKFYGEKSNLEDLKVFGCIAYERIVSKHLKKLDDRNDIEGTEFEQQPLNEDTNLEVDVHEQPIPRIIIHITDVTFHATVTPHVTVHATVTDEREFDHKLHLSHDLKEEVYVVQPEGFEKPGDERKVYKLAKSLYGVRQAPRAWNIKIDNTLKEMGFQHCMQEKDVYRMFKKRMASQFEMSDLGELTYYLGVEVDQEKDCVKIKQERYAMKILKEASMESCNATLCPMEPGLKLSKAEDESEVEATQYRKVVGCLRYLLHTYPYLTYSMVCNAMKLVGYSNSSHNVDINDGRSKLDTFSISLLAKVTGLERQKVIIIVDNKSEIVLSKNLVLHGRSKHIHIRYHFIREYVENKQVIVEHVSGENQRANPLIKALAFIRFKEMRPLLGVQELPLRLRNSG